MTAVPESDQAIGIKLFATSGPPCRATARSIAEDFKVEERLIPGLEPIQEPRDDYYPLYRVEKRSIDTFHMEKSLGGALQSRLSYGGMKDKRSVAVQFVTPTSRKSLRPPLITREKFTAELVGYLPRPLSRGMVRGNRFDIVLRDCCPEMPARIDEAFSIAQARKLPNFYGLQRFGSGGAATHLLGKALIKQDFEGAVRLMLLRPRATDSPDMLGARRIMAEGRYAEGARLFPASQDVEKAVAARLSPAPTDWALAIRAVPLRLRRLFVQAYQSYLFNRTISLACDRELDISRYSKGDNWSELSNDGLATPRVRGVRDQATSSVVPMVQLAGFAYRNYGSRFDQCLEEVMAEEGIIAKEFYVKPMQEVSAEGGFRRPHMAVADPRYTFSAGRAEMSFVLASGQYATILLREVIKPPDPLAAGFA